MCDELQTAVHATRGTFGADVTASPIGVRSLERPDGPMIMVVRLGKGWACVSQIKSLLKFLLELRLHHCPIVCLIVGVLIEYFGSN